MPKRTPVWVKQPAGWYPDPLQPQTTDERWWNGTRWTETTRTGSDAVRNTSTGAEKTKDEL